MTQPLISSRPWWQTDTYDQTEWVPSQWDNFWAGPRGVALVRVWPDGRTGKGWGLNPPKNETEGFMPRYWRGEFATQRVLYGYDNRRWNFAFVMRSLRLVCIDIDGKNGGLEHAKKLGPLPPTLGEVSKSGNGFHLFYLHEEEWDDEKGYGALGDRIGIEQGVDFRATGCVYHHPQQRWNGRRPAPLPDYLAEIMTSRDQRIAATNDRIVKILEGNDTTEVLLMHDEILTRLKKPIPQGKRNNTLFAIGAEMAQAGVPQWDDHLRNRAHEIGLPLDETEKLVRNIETYSKRQLAATGS